MFAFIPIAIVAFGIIAIIVSVAKQSAETKKKNDQHMESENLLII